MKANTRIGYPPARLAAGQKSGSGPRRWLAGAFFAVLTGCPLATDAALQVVATTPDLAAIAREIGGDKVSVISLTKPTEDAHFVDAKPSYILKLNRADILIEGGAELEIGWLPPLLEQARNPKLAPGAPGRVVASEGIEMLEIPAQLDRAKGDIHAAGNPHYLVDPANALVVAEHIAKAFARADASAAALYQGNALKFRQTLEKKLEEWQQRLAACRGRCFVCYHNSWPYFARRFGLQTGIYLEPKPGLPPTPGHLVEVANRMKRQQARVIFADPYINRRVAEKLANDTGAKVVDVAQFPGGVKGTEGGYVDLMDYLVKSTAAAFGE